jgi:hypothetical protein
MAEASVNIRVEAPPREHPPVSDLALWMSVLGGPFVFLLNLEVNYVMVDWACNTGTAGRCMSCISCRSCSPLRCALLGVALLRRVVRADQPARRWAERGRVLATLGISERSVVSPSASSPSGSR